MKVKCVNHSDIPTRDVLQVYVDPVDSAYRTPNPRLCGFLKVAVLAHEEVECSVALDADTFRVVNEKGQFLPGGDRYVFYVSTGGPDERSRELTGKVPVKVEVTQSGIG